VGASYGCRGLKVKRNIEHKGSTLKPVLKGVTRGFKAKNAAGGGGKTKQQAGKALPLQSTLWRAGCGRLMLKREGETVGANRVRGVRLYDRAREQGK